MATSLRTLTPLGGAAPAPVVAPAGAAKLGYQPHIDGLRALAILPVLLFHAHVAGFSGGFVGVDIFFVISGYLITRILAAEIAAGRFSLIGFYERRARRIVPALSVVLVAVLAAAALLYLPGDFESVPLSSLATTLSASNLYFFSEVGYFQTGAETKPLLHTWSLGIEEQFYVGFPILLFLADRYARRHLLAIVAAVAALSLAIAVAMQGDRSGFAFYLLPPRAWELMVGALLALGSAFAPSSRALREAIAGAGLVAVGWAVLTYDSHTVFPGVSALLPVLGAAALIQCAPGTTIGSLLGWRPLVLVGLISYSLYLWHWPLIVFTEYATDVPLSGLTRLAVLAAAALLATLSWRFVERPFRDRSGVGRRAIFIGSGVALGGIALVSAGMLALGGWPQRFPPEVAPMANAKDDFSPERARCHDTALRGLPACTLGAPGVAPTAMVWGDSHGVEIGYALSRLAAAQGRALIERTQSSCPPVLGFTAPEAPGCAAINRQVLDTIRADKRLTTIYLAGFWASPAYADTADGLDEVIATLLRDGRQVVLIGAVPPNRFDVPRRLARLAQRGKLDAAQGRQRVELGEAKQRIDAVAEQWRGPHFRYVDPFAVLCPDDHCLLLADGKSLYFDHHHLSATGAAWMLGGFAREQRFAF